MRRGSVAVGFQQELNASEADKNQLRLQKLKEAQQKKQELQDQLAKNELIKLSGMTPEEQMQALEEKKQQELLKQQQLALIKQKQEEEARMDAEINSLKSQITSLQADVNQTNQKQAKLNEIKAKLQDNVKLASMAISKYDSEVLQAEAQLQTAVINLKNT